MISMLIVRRMAALFVSLLLCGCLISMASRNAFGQSLAEDNGLSAELIEQMSNSVRLGVGGRNEVKTGRMMHIVLSEKQSIPYRWKAYILGEGKAKFIYDEGRTTGGNGMPGGDEGEHVFYFEAVEQGVCTITMRLERVGSDGSDESDFNSYSYTVFIRPDDSPEPTSAPTQPFALNVESGKAVCLGMSRDAVETVAGAPVAAGWGTRMEYEGLEIGYRGDAVVYILIDDERWNANGAIELGMPTQEAVEKLGMTFEDGCKAYTLCYSDDGDVMMLYPGDAPKEYATMLTLYVGSGGVNGIILCEKQYGLTKQ